MDCKSMSLPHVFSPNEGGSLLEACPCLLKFISTMADKTSSDPDILSFSLKLTGLIAAAEDSFKILQVELMSPGAVNNKCKVNHH